MISLDDLDAIKKYDRSDMAYFIESFPEQCREAERIGLQSSIPGSLKIKYRNIVCAGMGGSAIGADIARSYTADEALTPIFVNRNYTVPAFVGRESLVIVSSYSGNTEETLSAYKCAKARGASIIVISSGGILSGLAAKSSIPVVRIPPGLQPRAALGYGFFTLITVLSRIGVIGDKSKDVREAIRGLESLRDASLALTVLGPGNIAKDIARKIYMKMPVIYSGLDHLDAVSTRWRGQLAENAKTIASSNLFPEMTHNEIVGWEHPEKALKNLAVIMLRDRGDNPRTAKRMDIIMKVITSLGVKVVEINSRGKGLLSRIFSLIYIGDYVSLYLAILNKCDPTPVDRIT
ncbi:MAG: bifunctional phosphoglucose/phosphomannose isomerase, partial [Candidatus Omnitrophica bacterium]|nr:bifunctional phosphoglucose/phosphomannose isomerase [Candidatus Omnitrophota bacterium]